LLPYSPGSSIELRMTKRKKPSSHACFARGVRGCRGITCVLFKVVVQLKSAFQEQEMKVSEETRQFLGMMVGLCMAMCGAAILALEGPTVPPHGIPGLLLLVGLVVTTYNMFRWYGFDQGFAHLVEVVHRGVFGR
jgi:hypothetical protein